MTKNIIIIILIIGLIFVGSMYYIQLNNNDKLIEIIKNTREKSNLIIEDEYYYDYEIKKLDDGIYIPFNLVEKHIDEEIELSNSQKRVFININKINFEFEDNNLDDFVRNSLDKVNMPFRIIEGKKYLNIENIKRLYGVYYKYYEDQDTLFISKDYSDLKLVKNDRKTNLYINSNNYLVSIKEIDADNEMILFGQESINNKNYYKVLDNTGEIGLIGETKFSQIDDIEVQKLVFGKKEDTNIDKVNLIWQQINDFNDESNFNVEKIDNLNVISPTWFNLNIEGIVINIASRNYVEQAHENGYEVWGLFKNNFNPEWTNELINNEDYINKSISQMLFYSGFYNLDGINIDFENVYLKDKDALVNYVKEFRDKTKRMNLELSIDAVVPGGSDRYSKVIDRGNIQKHVDYFMLMAYDEHWGSSPKAGSVASLPWVEEGIVNTLEEVPNEKLVLGVPLYMRVWRISNNSIQSSIPYSIKKFPNYLENKNLTKEYNEETGQNYVEHKVNGAVEKVWIEDELSLEKRLKLFEKYNLAGIAAWSKGYEVDYYWELIEKYF